MTEWLVISSRLVKIGLGRFALSEVVRFFSCDFIIKILFQEGSLYSNMSKNAIFIKTNIDMIFILNIKC